MQFCDLSTTLTLGIVLGLIDILTKMCHVRCLLVKNMFFIIVK